MNQPHPCTYVTHRWGVHDERWTAALRVNGFTVTDISLERDNLSVENLRHRLMDSTDTILAGPLHITKALVETRAPLFGLSWGFDLIQAHNRNERLDWLTELSGLIVDSKNTRQIALNAGLKPDRTYTIPWGVDLEAFTPEGPRTDLAEFGIPNGNRIILSLRALEPLYRIEDIIRAFAQITNRTPDTHLIIGNDGSLSAQLKSLVTSLHLDDRISFIGLLSEASLPRLLRAADVYVTASEIDGSSVSLLQAMACGTPVVASNTLGNSEWVTRGATGLLFQVTNSADLATSLDNILNDSRPDSINQLVSGARAMVEQCADWAQNTKQLPQILSAHP